MAGAGAGADTEVQFEFFPIIRQYKSGRVERFMNPDPLPAGTDPATGVASKDVVVDPATGLWARLFLPPGTHGKKLPVLVYYHGGAYVIGSAADPFTHRYLNALVSEAGVLAVALEYRLASEHPLPAAYDDSWEGLKWVASHAPGAGGGSEPWLAEHGDFSRVFLAGASAGGTIAHNMAVRAGEHGLGLPIKRLLVVHPYFSGAADIGNEGTTGKAAKARADAFWRFLYPGSTGLDDPLSNPFSVPRGARRRRARARLRRREGRAPGQGRLVLREPQGQRLPRRGGAARVHGRGPRLLLHQPAVRQGAGDAGPHPQFPTQVSARPCKQGTPKVR